MIWGCVHERCLQVVLIFVHSRSHWTLSSTLIITRSLSGSINSVCVTVHRPRVCANRRRCCIGLFAFPWRLLAESLIDSNAGDILAVSWIGLQRHLLYTIFDTFETFKWERVTKHNEPNCSLNVFIVENWRIYKIRLSFESPKISNALIYSRTSIYSII